MKKYQDCSLIVKIYRQIKWKPIYFVIATYYWTRQLLFKKCTDGYGMIFKPSFIFLTFFYGWQTKANWIYEFNE